MEANPLLEDPNQHVNADGGPDLRLHRVFGGAVKPLDLEMLLDPFEKQFYSPPRLVQDRDDDGGEEKIVGEKDEVLARFRIVIMNVPKRLGVIRGRLDSRKHDGLIGSQPRRFVEGMRITPLEWRATTPRAASSVGLSFHKTFSPNRLARRRLAQMSLEIRDHQATFLSSL